VKEIHQRFAVDHVTLCVALDPEDVLFKAQDGPKGEEPLPFLRIVDPGVLKRALPRILTGPILKGRGSKGFSPFFSKEELAEIRSKAVIPLFISRELIGTLNLGSRDPHRYTSDKGTDFLKGLGSKISLAMDNILARQRLLVLSITDSLTGLSNRRYFDAVLEREFERAQRYGTALACMVLDLDGFKALNDRFGHQTGDKALRYVASVLRGNSRGYDVVARYGGDEFAVLLPQTSLEAAARVAEKYVRELHEHPFVAGESPIVLRLSFGVAAISELPLGKPADLVKEADRRLYLAKGQLRAP
jgi:diguanylate cyclase (GGDEF)-like protein